MIKAKCCPYCRSKQISEVREVNVYVEDVFGEEMEYKCKNCGKYFVVA